jgi:hypothetical protein
MWLTFLALAWLIGFLHGWYARGYRLKHSRMYEQVDDSAERPLARVRDGDQR